MPRVCVPCICKGESDWARGRTTKLVWVQGDGGRRRVWVMGEGGGGKLKLGDAQGNGRSESDGEIRRTDRDKEDKEEDSKAGVCAG